MVWSSGTIWTCQRGPSYTSTHQPEKQSPILKNLHQPARRERVMIDRRSLQAEIDRCVWGKRAPKPKKKERWGFVVAILGFVSAQ